MQNYTKKILELCRNHNINRFMAEKLLDSVDDINISEEMFNLIASDAIMASDLDVVSEKDYNLYFYIKHFLDDMLADTFNLSLSDDEKKQLLKYIFKSKDKYKFNNLTDFRILVHKWLNDTNIKKAHPNISGIYKMNKTYDTDKWVEKTKQIYKLINAKQIPRNEAFEFITGDLEEEEKESFNKWLKYYESGNTEKYNVKNAMNKNGFNFPTNIPSSLLNQPQSQTQTTFVEQKENKKEKAMSKRKQMYSRISSLRKLLREYKDLVSDQNISEIINLINRLETNVLELKVDAMLQSCFVRTASIMEKHGFKRGAEELTSLAEELSPTAKDIVKSQLVDNKENVTIYTIIQKLEGVSNNLKSRDIVRELAAIDILLSDINMASYFSELSDAQSKLNDALGYASNKVEDVISKLRGGQKEKKDVKPTGPIEIKTPETKPISITKPGPDVIGPPKSPPKEIAPMPLQQPVPAKEDIRVEELQEKPVGEVKTKLPE